jgi:hypothetical protein
VAVTDETGVKLNRLHRRYEKFHVDVFYKYAFFGVEKGQSLFASSRRR